MRKVFVAVIGCSLLCGCSVTKHKLPLNYVDKPAVLPKGMIEHPVQFDKSIYDIRKKDAYYILPIVSGLVGLNRGIEGDWEMHSLLPFFTRLIGTNNYYQLGRIDYNKFHHLISFGISGLQFSSSSGMRATETVGYQNIYVGHGNYRNHGSVWFSFAHDKNVKAYEISMENELASKWSQRLSGSVTVGGKLLSVSGKSYYDIRTLDSREQGSYGNGQLYWEPIRLERQFTQFVGCGLQLGVGKYLYLRSDYQILYFQKQENWKFWEESISNERMDYWKFTANVVW